MIKFRIWLLTQLIKLSDYTLTLSDDQVDINEVVSMRNYFIQSREKLYAKGE